jgi:serine/threonine protein kinase
VPPFGFETMDYRQVLQTGTVLDGKYRIERVIGSGGFGITYEAFDIGLASPVAIKEYYPSQFGVRDATFSVRPRSERDREIFDRLLSSFLREARTLNQFEHPAIVRVLSVFEAYGTAYMVMKYETGPSLKAWLANLVRLPTQSELDRLVPPLLDALEMMHNADFLHRDIAPDNIIVRSDGSPVLLDFGASRRVMGEMTGTLTGVVKKGYSPQEQYATDSRSQGPWTDIYALGATLYRCISGETPSEATERMLDDSTLPAVEAGAGRYRHEFLAAIDAAILLRPKQRPASIAIWREMLYEGMLTPLGQPQSWPTAGRADSDVVDESRHWDTSGAPGSHPRSGPRSAPSLRHSGGPRSQPSAPAHRSGPSYGFGGAGERPLAGSPPSQSTPTPKRRNMSAIAMVLGAVAIIGGGGLVLAMRVKEPSSQERAQKDAADAKRIQDEQLARLQREVEAQRIEAERLRLQAEEEQRRQAEAEADRQRRQADAERLRRQAEEAERQNRQAEAERLRREAEEAERQRQLAEAAERERQRQQALEAERQRQLEATRRAEAERQRLADEARRAEAERQRLADEARRAEAERRRQAEAEAERVRQVAAAAEAERRRQAEAEAARKQAEEAIRLAARPRQLAYSTPGATATFPVAVQTNSRLIVAGGSDGALKAWDAATGAPREFSGTKHTDAVSSIAVSPDDQQVVTGAWGGEIILWSLNGTARRFRNADAGDSRSTGRRWVVATEFISPTQFVSVLSDGTAETWDTTRPGTVVATVNLNATGIKAADISRNGSTIATGTDAGGLALFRRNDGQVIRQLPSHGDWVLALAFAWNVDRMGSGSADGIVRIQSTNSTGQPRDIPAHSTAVRAITFSANGARLATGGDDGTVTVWDANSGLQLASYKEHRSSVRSLALSPDGMRLVSASEDGDVRVWYLDTLVQASAPAGTNTQR